MNHDKKTKGDLAVAKVILKLTEMGYDIFLPAFTEHLPFDLIAYKDEKCIRIQVKYSAQGRVSAETSWADKNGSHKNKYKQNDFDYYAIYHPHTEKIVFPAIKYKGITINFELKNSSKPFYWYEDFIEIHNNEVSPKTCKNFGYVITSTQKGKSREQTRKVIRPSKEELFKLIWEKPTLQLAKEFGVSDKAIEKWCKFYEIEKPPRGYWAKKRV
jgi:hypothetical protein